MITAIVTLCGLCVLEAWLILCMAIWINRLTKDLRDWSEPLDPVEVEDDKKGEL